MSNISTTLPDASKGSVTFAYLKRSLKDKEASEYIGMSESWLRHNRISGQRLSRIAGPRFIKVGRSVRYLMEDLDAWLAQFPKRDHLAQQDSEGGVS
jgi:predicted DNA-binding transcriptional regulator AlpA